MSAYRVSGRPLIERDFIGTPLLSRLMKMLTRAARAALLDRKAFTEAFFDDDAAADGAIIVAGVGALTYLGWWVRGFTQLSVAGLFGVLIASIISWLILALATWFVATRLFAASSRPPTMMAMHGLAALPLVSGESFAMTLVACCRVSDWSGTWWWW